MRTSTAVALAAMSALLVVGCKGKTGSSGSSSKKTSRIKKSGKGPVTTAPASFTITPLNEAGREQRAKRACDDIAAERKKRIEGLVHVLNTGTPIDKVKAANTLSDLCDVMAVPFLLTRTTNDPSRDVKLASIAALGHIADPAAAPTLIALLDDEDLGIAVAALDALSEMTGGNYAFVNGTTIKIRKAEKAKWEAKLKEGFFKKK